MHDDGRQFACKCLNVRIREQPAGTSPPEWPTDSSLDKLYVGENGITIVHPQVTSRVRSRGTSLAETSRSPRYVSLMCLICNSYVYRVCQEARNDADAKDAPLVPPEGWIENEPMKSSSGWIEVHKDCLTGDAINRAQSDAEYSALFSVVVPSPTSLPPSPKPVAERLTPITPPSPQPPKQYLPDLRPLFPPPPFSPAHPVFIHLSSLASTEAEKLRADAEESVAQFVRAKVAEVEQAETRLKLQVECIWKTYRAGFEQLHQTIGNGTPSTPVRHNSGHKETPTRQDSGAPVSIRDFVPALVPPTRPISASYTRRVSSLSASLATSTFHHPRAQSADNRIETASHTSNQDASTLGSSPTASSPSSRTLVAHPHTIEGSSVLQFPRNTNDTINTAASYRYFLLEEEMTRKKREQELARTEQSNLKPEASSTAPTVNTRSKSQNKPSPDQKAGEGKERADESRGQEKGKKKERKVTFDVQPAVVTINTDVNAESEVEEAREEDSASEMVFDLEEEGSERSVSDESRPILPLIEQPAPSRPNRPKSTRANHSRLAGGLPESFAALRPTSLPLPSHIRPPRSHQGVDSSSSQAAMFSPPPRASNSSSRLKTTELPPEDPPTPREAEILQLLAADIPSHRGAWRRDGKAWQTFVRRQENGDNEDDNTLPEEDDDDIPTNGADLHRIFVGSMPINIRLRKPPKQALSLASYQPTAAIHNGELQRETDSVARSGSAAAVRKASYAERDRTRSMDPGALDFASVIEEDEENVAAEGDDTTGQTDGEDGSRAKKHALEILKARNKLPEPGMWRSLA